MHAHAHTHACRHTHARKIKTACKTHPRHTIIPIIMLERMLAKTMQNASVLTMPERCH